MNLIIDSGNTSIKAALFDKGAINKVFHSIDYAGLEDVCIQYKPSKAIIASVRKDQEKIKTLIPGINPIVLSLETPVPIVNAYQAPTLGMDRLAAAVGAEVLFEGKTVLIIDAGTCIKFDILHQRQFLGGAISPGLDMRFKAHNTFTAGLPLVNMETSDFYITGKTTVESILSGVFYGMLGEIEGFIRKYKEIYPSLQVVLSGGNSKLFETKIKESIFVCPELVLIGLNRILEYND